MIKVRNAICWNCGGMQPMAERFTFRNISIQLMNGSTDRVLKKLTTLLRFTTYTRTAGFRVSESTNFLS